MASFPFIKRTLVAAFFAAGATAMVGCASAPDAEDARDEEASEETEEALVGKACGARLGDTCGRGEYCRFSVRAQCGRADATGKCARRPTSCSWKRSLVCGCDGRTYYNSCSAHAHGVSALSTGACAPACDPAKFDKVIAPTLAELKGFWSRREVVGFTETIEELSLRSDSTYKLHKVVGPFCTPGGLCPKFATRFFESNGTFDLQPGHGVQLHPVAGSSAELPSNFGVEKSCAPALRLTSTEAGVAIVLTKNLDRCVEDAECSSRNLGPQLACGAGAAAAKACDADTSTCGWACKEATACPAGQRKCMSCGAPPPDGICRAFVCVAGGTMCPLFP